MNDNGFVYVLMNPSLNNLVKIGKSTRTPEERSKELSAATGVPTPFSVVYECYFENCSDAEAFVHTYLENKGFRLAKNREFFEISIKDAIDAVIEAKNHFGEFTQKEVEEEEEEEIVTFESETDDDFLDNLDFKEKVDNPGKLMMLLGLNYFNGDDDDYLQDYEEAHICFEKARKLGYIPAYSKLGSNYRYGMGVKKNNSLAFKYFKEGAKQGDNSCYAHIATLMETQDHIENARKSWKKYFEISKLNEDDVYEVGSYIYFLTEHNLEFLYQNKIKEIKDELIDYLIESRDEGEDDWDYQHYNKQIKFVKKYLGEKESISEDSITLDSNKSHKKSFWNPFN